MKNKIIFVIIYGIFSKINATVKFIFRVWLFLSDVVLKLFYFLTSEAFLMIKIFCLANTGYGFI